MANSVEDDTIEVKPEPGSENHDNRPASVQLAMIKGEITGDGSRSPSPPPSKIKSSQSSPSANSVKSSSTPQTPIDKKDSEEKRGGDIHLKMEPSQPPKLSRSSSQKASSKGVHSFEHLPDATDEAKSSFDLMEACTYSNKYLGYTEHAMECDCSEEWSKHSSWTHAKRSTRLLEVVY